jgi:hypothetical protein
MAAQNQSYHNTSAMSGRSHDCNEVKQLTTMSAIGTSNQPFAMGRLVQYSAR